MPHHLELPASLPVDGSRRRKPGVRADGIQRRWPRRAERPKVRGELSDFGAGPIGRRDLE